MMMMTKEADRGSMELMTGPDAMFVCQGVGCFLD